VEKKVEEGFTHSILRTQTQKSCSRALGSGEGPVRGLLLKKNGFLSSLILDSGSLREELASERSLDLGDSGGFEKEGREEESAHW